MKYRVFDKNSKTYCTENVELSPSGKLKIHGIDMTRNGNYRVDISTGILDINGTEIFQNDKIENHSGRQFFVEWCHDRFQYREIYSAEKLQECPQNSIGEITKCRVVPYDSNSKIDNLYRKIVDRL